MVLDVEQELHVHAEALHALGKLSRDVEGEAGLGRAVDAEAAHAAARQVLKLAVGDALADQRDAAQRFRDAP